MKILQGLLLLLIVTVAVTGCSSGTIEKKRSAEEPPYVMAAREKLRAAHVEYLFNAPKTFVICMTASKPTSLLPQHHVVFIIYDMRGGTIIHEDELANGDVGWHNDYQVKVTMIPGTIKDDDPANQPLGYLYDLRLNKKIDLSSYQTK